MKPPQLFGTVGVDRRRIDKKLISGKGLRKTMHTSILIIGFVGEVLTPDILIHEY
jgi:hypothetical protein